MRLLVSDEWLRKRLADEDEPGGCSHCGAIAGCCEKYPDCPGGKEAEQSRLPANEARSPGYMGDINGPGLDPDVP